MERLGEKVGVVLTESQKNFIVRRAAGHARDAVMMVDLLTLTHGELEYVLLDDQILKLMHGDASVLPGILSQPLARVRQDLGSLMLMLSEKYFLKGEQVLPNFELLFAKFLKYHDVLTSDEAMGSFLMSLCPQKQASVAINTPTIGERF